MREATLINQYGAFLPMLSPSPPHTGSLAKTDEGRRGQSAGRDVKPTSANTTASLREKVKFNTLFSQILLTKHLVRRAFLNSTTL